MPVIRFATYNIHKARGLDGRTRVERIARVLQEIEPDIVALQEVVSHADAVSPEEDQAKYLGDVLGRFQVMGQTKKHRGGAYGNVTLSRWDFEFVRQLDLSVARREERGVLRTDVRGGGQVLHVFNVHLGTGHAERRLQASRFLDKDILRALDITGPRIVLGDFNEWTRGLVTRTLSAEFHMTDLRLYLSRTRTYPAVLPLLHLDHIYFDHHFRVERAFFHRSRLALMASDHLPLVADLSVDD
jgi:endonuclease/exonuclease/phosphatase family metal-dependent hydrolase